MQHTVGGPAGRSQGSILRRSILGCGSAASFAVATLVTGCGVGGGVISPMPEPTSATAPADPNAHVNANRPVPPQAAPQPHLITVTGQQRAYLDALEEAGLQPSEELAALSIGSYVCQARAARLSDQAVWDFVFPLVRNDVGDARSERATAKYIRIASERLC